MARNNRNGGRGGAGRGRGRGRGGQRGRSSTGSSGVGSTAPTKRGLCAALGANLFTYNEKGSADAVPKTLKAIIKHVGATMSTDNAKELETRAHYVVPDQRLLSSSKMRMMQKNSSARLMDNV